MYSGIDDWVATLVHDVISTSEPVLVAASENTSSSTSSDMHTVTPLQTSVFYSSRKRQHKESDQPTLSRPDNKRKSRMPIRYDDFKE
jgi:hypothetical protein